MRTLLALALLAGAARADDTIDRLGSDDFDTREAASAALRARGWSAAPLLRANRNHDDPEVRTRCRLLFEYAVEDKLASYEPLPMIDALYYDPIVRQDYLYESELHHRLEPYLEAAGGRCGHPYAQFRGATRLLVREWLERGDSPFVVGLRLQYMHAIDAAWVRDHRLGDSRLDELAVTPWQREAFPRWRAEKAKSESAP